MPHHARRFPLDVVRGALQVVFATTAARAPPSYRIADTAMATPPDSQFVSWFRSVAPYFHAFRGRTFVIAFGGEVAGQRKFASLVNDLNLLHSAGIRLVLVHGS